MTAADLITIGAALYGPNVWRARLARALGVNERTVRRWASGDQDIPGPVAIAVAALYEAHMGKSAH